MLQNTGNKISSAFLRLPKNTFKHATANYNVLRYALVNQQGHTMPRLSNFQNPVRFVHHRQETFGPRAKKLGWIVSGSLIAVSMYYYGKWCLLFAVVPLIMFSGTELYFTMRMLPRDITFLKRYIRMLMITRSIVRNSWTINSLFNKIVAKKPMMTMIRQQENQWKYKEMQQYTNQVSRLLQKHGHGKGDVVGIMVGNSPEMIGFILGASQIGIIGALLNTNLKQKALAHCIDISDCKSLIVGEEYIEAIEAIRKKLKSKKIIMFQFKGKPRKGYFQLEKHLAKERVDAPEMFIKIHHDDLLVYIYTSGTSGTPKAAVIPHSKFLVSCFGASILLGMRKSDLIYDPLPLYHTTGLICGVGQAINRGIPVVIRSRFSAHNYFPECVKYNCTIGQYIGEICRYILLTEPNIADRTHKVRRMLGNGLNYELWQEFQDRFKVKITELYGATEGNCNMLNIDGKVGAVGFLPKIVPSFLYPYYLVRIDNDTQQIIRGPNGLCVKCDYNEPGMLVGLIRDRVDTKYHGYKSDDKKATESKIIKDVFKKGDKAFMTGDILVIDEFLYFYFRDRTGDSYRWKGENVSSTEIENIAATVSRTTCACFGVRLKGHLGRAGMLVIEDPKGIVDLDRLFKGLMKNMPKYAVPRFIRIVKKIPMTSTHKVKKVDYMKEGIDISIIKDKLFYLDMATSQYKPLTKEALQQIEDLIIPM